MKTLFMILCITLISLFNSVISWVKCNNEIACASGYSCITCNNKIGCCRFENGVCCGNGMNCCPEGSICSSGSNVCIPRLKFDLKKSEPIYQEKIEEATNDYLRNFLNGFFSEINSIYKYDFSRIFICVDTSLKGNKDFNEFVRLTKQAKDLKTIISLFQSGSFIFRDLAGAMYNCKVSIMSFSNYLFELSKLIIERPLDILEYIYNNIINNIPRLAINIIEIQDLFQNKNYYEVSGIFAGKVYNVILEFLSNRKQLDQTISLFQVPDKPLSLDKSNGANKENCTKISSNTFILVNELISKINSEHKLLVGIMNNLFTLYSDYNNNCIGNAYESNSKSIELKSIYYFGLENQSLDKTTVEASNFNKCKEKIDILLNKIEKGLIGFKDLNNFNEVLTSINDFKTFLSNLQKENTICNNIIDKINTVNQEKPKKLVDNNQIECENMAQTISIEISKIIKHSEDKTYNPQFMVSLTNTIYLTHQSYNMKCINLANKFSLPYYDLKSVYYYGLDLHSHNEENSIEIKFIQNCKEKIDILVGIIENGFGGLKDLNKFSLVNDSHLELKKALENQRKENTICNTLMDKLYEHFTSPNKVEETTSNVLRKMDQEGCKNMANIIVININEIIKKTEDPNILREEGELIKLSNLIYNMLKQFNSECVDTDSSSSIARIDLKSLYIHGLENHIKNDEKDKPEELYVKSCRDRIEKIVSIIEEELIPDNDMNSMLKVTKESLVLKELLRKLRSENTICNQLMDRVYTHFQVKSN